MTACDKVLQFWFESLTPQAWWQKDAELDQQIARQFSNLHAQASHGELFTWRNSPRGRLAEIIILDQFSRNIFRGKPQAFACDRLALVLAQEAVAQGITLNFSVTQRAFFYMPYMHSESKVIHAEAVKLFSDEGMDDNLRFEFLHKKIIDQFGRYPHRNAILGRETSREEEEFLKTPGSSF